MIDRAIAEHAGTAKNIFEEDIVIAQGPCRALVGRPEQRHHRPADRGSEVHRTRVVRDDNARARRDPDQRAEAGVADEIDNPIGRIRIENIFSDHVWHEIDRVNVIACGTAYHAGLMGKYMFEKLLRLPTDVFFSSEFRYGDLMAMQVLDTD